MKAKDYRKIARDECKPFSSNLAVMELFIFVAFAILGVVGIIPYYIGAAISTIAGFLIVGPIAFSEVSIAKKIKNKDKPKIEDWFLGFHRFIQSFVLSLLFSIFVFLWSLLLIVPGIIKTLSYSQAIYLSHDDSELDAIESITKSRELMVGYKWKLFCLNISYIGWILLSILTLGILLLWVAPKIRQANYAFHLNLMKEKSSASSKVEGEELTEKIIEVQGVNVNKERSDNLDK